MNLVLKSVVRSCPICDCEIGEILHTQKFVLPEGHPQAAGYDVVCCENCGFVYADTPTSQSDYTEYYTKFSRYNNTAASIGGGIQAFDAGRLQHTAIDITNIVPDKNARIVDIGCVSGGLLRTLHRLGYTNLCGIDPALSCVAQTHQLPEIEAYVGTLTDLPAKVGQVDCFTLSHVLEHMRDLKPALVYLRKFLKPNGCIYVEVPDALRYSNFMLSPFQEFNTEHLNHFSPTCMANLLRQCGFAPIRSETKVFLLSPNGPQSSLFVFAAPSDAVPVLTKDEKLKVNLKEYIAISRRMLNEIDARLRHVLDKAPEVMVWGTGQLALRLLAETSLGDADIIAFVDGNPIHQGLLLRGVPILAPSQVKPSTTPIIVTSILHYHDICENARQLGLPNPIIALGEKK